MKWCGNCKCKKSDERAAQMMRSLRMEEQWKVFG